MRRYLTWTLGLLAATGCADAVGDPAADGTTDPGAVIDTALPAEDTPALATLDVAVYPEDPLPGDSLRCAADVTGSVTYQWFRDGEPTAFQQSVLDGSQVAGRQAWTCEVTSARGGVGRASIEVEESCTSHQVDGVVWRPYAAELDLRTTPFTVEAWYDLDVGSSLPASSDVRFVIVRRGDSLGYDDASTDFGLHLAGTEALRFVTGGDDDGCDLLEAPAPTVGGWHHVAGTFDARSGEKVLWIDGREAARCIAQGRPRSAFGSAEVGGHMRRGEIVDRFVGWIDEVRVTRRVRYDGPFSPETYGMSDDDTVWNLHFDRVGQVPFGPIEIRGTFDASGLGLHPEVDARVEDVSDVTSTCDISEVVSQGG